MKITTKITSLALAGALLLSMSGCSLLGGSKIGPKKLLSYAEDDGAEVAENAKKFNKYDKEDMEDGVVVHLEGKDVKTVLGEDDVCVLPVLDDFYNKHMTEATVYTKIKIDGDEAKSTAVYAFSIVFEDEDSAEDYFDEVHDGIQPNPGVDANNDDGTDENIDYSVMNIIDGANNAAVGVYRDGNTVLFLIGYGRNNKKIIKTIDGLCEDFGVHLVSDT